MSECHQTEYLCTQNAFRGTGMIQFTEVWLYYDLLPNTIKHLELLEYVLHSY